MRIVEEWNGLEDEWKVELLAATGPKNRASSSSDVVVPAAGSQEVQLEADAEPRELEEGRLVACAKDPGCPTKAERDEHEAIHLPCYTKPSRNQQTNQNCDIAVIHPCLVLHGVRD